MSAKRYASLGLVGAGPAEGPRYSGNTWRSNTDSPGGLKARASLAQGEALGQSCQQGCGLKARVKPSIPHEPLIEFHPVLREHRAHLRLKIPLAVMFCLIVDVSHQGRAIAQANRKYRIPFLPTEP